MSIISPKSKKSEEYYRTRGANEFGANYVEFSVERKNEGRDRMMKPLLILLYIVASLAYIVVTLVLTKAAPLIAILPLLIWILVFFTWRYTKVEYEYAIIQGAFNFSTIYGGRTRRDGIEVKIKDMTMIAPLTPETKAKAEAPDIKHLYNYLSHSTSPNAYVAFYADENEEKCALYFEALEKTLKICKFHNAAATVMK